MAEAFECDRCGEYYNGKPFKKLELKECSFSYSSSSSVLGLNHDWSKVETIELCKDCYEKLMKFLED